MKKIRKTYSGVVPNGKVLNSRNNSLQDTYSSDYLNRTIPDTKDLGDIVVDDITCKNLLPNNIQNQTINGVVITKNNDGSITFNGTSTAAIRVAFRINLSLSSGKYTHSIKNAVPTGSYLSLDNIDYTMIRGTTDGNKITFTLTKETTFSQYIIYFDPNITFNNVTIFPQVEKGNETDYVEHKEFSNKQIYSTNEVIVGTWEDSKNVYRRTIKTTTANATNTLKSLGIIENLKEIIANAISYKASDNIKYLTDNPSEAPVIFIEASNNIQESHKSDYFNNCLITITLIYTKTTD